MKHMGWIVFALVVGSVVCGLGYAKVPQVGDLVTIYVGDSYSCKGTITDIENGMICLDTNEVKNLWREPGTPRNICIGIGSISFIEPAYTLEQEEAIYQENLKKLKEMKKSA